MKKDGQNEKLGVGNIERSTQECMDVPTKKNAGQRPPKGCDKIVKKERTSPGSDTHSTEISLSSSEDGPEEWALPKRSKKEEGR